MSVYTAGMINPRLTVFHYHLLPGGVTTVITTGLEALISSLPEIKEITLVTGRTENTDLISGRLKTFAKSLNRTGLKITVCLLPETGYAVQPYPKGNTAGTAAEKLTQKLIDEFGGSLWWIHNYHIGKNPVLTRAVIQTAAQYPEQNIFLQIHDFPESGRLQNLKGLEGITPLYPDSPNIHYLTINERDRKILTNAGLKEKQVTFLANPVKVPKESLNLERIEKTAIKNKLKDAFGEIFPGFNPKNPCAFYPVRSIRRKNILEAGLLTLLSRENINLIVTLPGVSEQEKAFSNLVEDLFQRGVIPGLWGTGRPPLRKGDDIPEFIDIAGACDFVLSTSLQEGFGYLFVEAALWGKRLFSRQIDILNEITPLLHPDRCRRYGSIRIPLDGMEKEAARQAYEEHADGLQGILPDTIIKRLRDDFEQLAKAESTDFSYLPIQLQAGILEKVSGDKTFKEKCQRLNSSLIDSLSAALAPLAMQKEEEEGIKEYFGLEAFAARVRNIIEPPPPRSYEEAVMEAFNTPYYHRMIFQPYSGPLREE